MCPVDQLLKRGKKKKKKKRLEGTAYIHQNHHHAPLQQLLHENTVHHTSHLVSHKMKVRRGALEKVVWMQLIQQLINAGLLFVFVHSGWQYDHCLQSAVYQTEGHTAAWLFIS